MPTIEGVMALQANMSESEFDHFMRYQMFCPMCPFKTACDGMEDSTKWNFSCAELAKAEIEKYKNKDIEETTPPEKSEPKIHCYSFSQDNCTEIIKITPDQKKLLDWMIENEWTCGDANIVEITEDIEDFTK